MIQKDHLKESLRYWNTRKLLHERNGYVAAGKLLHERKGSSPRPRQCLTTKLELFFFTPTQSDSLGQNPLQTNDNLIHIKIVLETLVNRISWETHSVSRSLNWKKIPG